MRAKPKRLAELIWNLPGPVYVMTDAGEILDANPAFLELIASPSLTAARKLDAGALWCDAARRGVALQEIARHGMLLNFEFELCRLDGTHRTVLDTCYAVRLAGYDSRVICGALVDITERKAAEVELRRQAVRDPLTGCYNRRYLEALDSKLGPNDVWGAIVADIDRFKRYNDQFGHAAGDDALIRLARFLTAHVRPTDIIVRMGGDEFLILLFGQDTRYLTDVAVRFQLTAPQAAPVPFSLGWAVRDGEEPLQATIERADQQLIHVRIQERRDRAQRRGDAEAPATDGGS